MRQAREIVHERAPDLAIEGEMRGDAALSQDVLEVELPDSGFPGPANVLIMPSVDAANIVQSAAHGGWSRGYGARHSAWRRKAGSRSDPISDRSTHRQHDSAGGRRCKFARGCKPVVARG
jgi:hypothetical protein